MPTYVEYLRGNYAACYFDLTNWIYRQSDKIEIIFRHHSAPNYRTDWPALCTTNLSGATNTDLYVNWNLWSNRTALNIRHSGYYSGDGNYSYNTPYDYENYYKFTGDGSSFSLGKSPTLDNFNDVFTATLGTSSDTDTLSMKIFNPSYPADIELYQVIATRGGTIIHDYRPTTTGLYDVITNTEIESTGTGWTPGPELPPPPTPTSDVELVLQYSASENNRVDKVLTEIATYTGTLRQSTSIIDPVFIVECSLPDVIGANYLTVAAFGRSYFIKNITSHRAGLVEFNCHVDVLSSFKTQLRTNRAIVHRSEKNWNLYLNDGSLKVKQTPKVTTQEFPGSFGNSYSYILVLAG